MANTFIKPSVIAKMAISTLYNNAVMPGLVWRDFDDDFTGEAGDTITVRVPATFTAAEFTTATSVQDITETSVQVVLNKHLDVTVNVTAKQLSLELGDFERRVVAPAMEAIVQKIDTLLLGLRSDVVQNVGTNGTTPTDPLILVDSGKLLNDNAVPLSDRHCVVDTAAGAEFLKDPLFHQADQRGDTEGLREATIGRKFGADIYQDQNIADGDGVMFHRTAFVLASRVLPKPMGLPSEQVAIVNYKGFGLRVTMDYDHDAKTDKISFDTLVGVKTVDASRAVEILG